MGIFFTGFARHGKDSAAEIVKKHFGLTFAASSEFACDLFLFDKLKDEFGYATKEQCFADRVNHRQRWFDEIVAFNSPDLGRLGELIFEKHDIYCGIRNLDELNVLREKGLGNLVIWVDATAPANLFLDPRHWGLRLWAFGAWRLGLGLGVGHTGLGRTCYVL